MTAWPDDPRLDDIAQQQAEELHEQLIEAREHADRAAAHAPAVPYNPQTLAALHGNDPDPRSLKPPSRPPDDGHADGIEEVGEGAPHTDAVAAPTPTRHNAKAGIE